MFLSILRVSTPKFLKVFSRGLGHIALLRDPFAKLDSLRGTLTEVCVCFFPGFRLLIVFKLF